MPQVTAACRNEKSLGLAVSFGMPHHLLLVKMKKARLHENECLTAYRPKLKESRPKDLYLFLCGAAMCVCFFVIPVPRFLCSDYRGVC